MQYIYFDTPYAIARHDKIIEISGGIMGVIDVGLLEATLQHIQNDDYYPTFEEKLTHLVFCVNKNHCFQDGNKRTSVALGGFFLEVNGLHSLVDKFIIEMENICVAVADNLIDKNLLSEIVTSLLNEDEYSESLKLKIIAALGPIESDQEDEDTL